MLQWGRVVADAEGDHALPSVNVADGFNGAASLPTRKASVSVVSTCRPLSFNGAASLPTRKASVAHPGQQQPSASMGPRRCRRGRLRPSGRTCADSGRFNGAASLPTRKAEMAAKLAGVSAKLQWGRVVADAEGGCRPRRYFLTRMRFNGAASLPTRKGCRRCRPWSRSRSFNGAASLPTRKA